MKNQYFWKTFFKIETYLIIYFQCHSTAMKNLYYTPIFIFDGNYEKKRVPY